MTPALVVEDVSFAYPRGPKVLDHLSLTVAAGQRVALLGANGAGKTTFALHLNGVLELQSGRITVNGLPLQEQNLGEIRRRVGMVFQNADDQLFMPSVREDVAFGPANLKLPKEEQASRVAEALAAVEATALADRAPHHLSGGEKRRVAIAGVLAMRPDLLVLDEPTSGLDPAGRRELADLLTSLALTQLVITHDLPFALELCPRSVIVSAGTVVADGPTPEILADTELLAANRLELPFGFDPRTVRRGDATG
jgi:cobalt transport protein ATP-binding subunit